MINYEKEYAISIAVESGDRGVKTLKIRSTDFVCHVHPWSARRWPAAANRFRGGVYILFGGDNAREYTAYIGVAGAPNQWGKKKWTQAVFFTMQSKEETLNSAMLECIAAGLRKKAVEYNYKVVSPDFSSESGIPQDDEVTCNCYLNAIDALWHHIGIYIYGGFPPPSTRMYECKFKTSGDVEYSAWGYVTQSPKVPGRFVFVVMKGTYAINPDTSNRREGGFNEDRDDLIKRGALIPIEGKEICVFAEDVPFDKPSPAASLVRGVSSSGHVWWKTKDGIPLDDTEDGKRVRGGRQ